MKLVPKVITVAALAALASCGGGMGMPGPNSASNNTSGPPPTFEGTGVDSNPNTGSSGGMGTTVVSFTMMQSGPTVSGTVTTQSTDARIAELRAPRNEREEEDESAGLQGIGAGAWRAIVRDPWVYCPSQVSAPEYVPLTEFAAMSGIVPDSVAEHEGVES